MSDAATTPTAPRRATQATPLWPIGLAAGAVAAIALATVACRGGGAEGLQLLNRYLARLGFLLFVPIYAASPLRTLAPGAASRWLVRRRRSLGLAYALVMAAHLATILAWFATPEVPVETDAATIGGGVGMLWIAALAATSNDAAVGRLGPRAWKRLHTGALHFLWIVYLVTYGGRVAESGPTYLPGLVAVLALPALRAAALWQRRRACPAATGS